MLVDPLCPIDLDLLNALNDVLAVLEQAVSRIAFCRKALLKGRGFVAELFYTLTVPGNQSIMLSYFIRDQVNPALQRGTLLYA